MSKQIELPTTPAQSCVFCARIAAGEVIESSERAASFLDGFPISPGHTLVVPRRHVADWFELSAAEQHDIMLLAGTARTRLEVEFSPDGWNIGVNIGTAGGQTIGHVHLHLVPRYRGDREDPRGGVRWILPQRADYWTK